MMSTSSTSDRRVLGVLLIVALLLRALLPITVLWLNGESQAFYTPDTSGYIQLAKHLLWNGSFGVASPELIRTPGYPLLMIPGLSLGSLELVTIVLQILLSTATVALVYSVGRLLFVDSTSALLAAGLAAIEPLSILYTSMLLTEVLFTFLVMLFIYLVLRCMGDGRWRDVIFAAAVIAAATFVRPVSYFLPVGIGAIMLLLTLVSDSQRWRRSLQIAVFVCVAMGITAAWQLRNLAAADYGGFSAISDINLYFYQGASVLAAKQGKSYYQVQQELGYSDEDVYYARHPEQRTWPAGERYRFLRREALEILADNPFTYAKIHIAGTLRMLADPGAISYLRILGHYPQSGGLLGEAVDQGIAAVVVRLFKERPLLFWSNLLLGLLLGLYYLLSAIGLLSGRFDAPAAVLLLAVGAYFVLVSGGPAAENRFRLPIMPIVCLFSGAGLSVIWKRFKRRGIGAEAA